MCKQCDDEKGRISKGDEEEKLLLLLQATHKSPNLPQGCFFRSSGWFLCLSEGWRTVVRKLVTNTRGAREMRDCLVS